MSTDTGVFNLKFLANYPSLVGLCVAIGIGLLIGAERERQKATRANLKSAGIRTFAVVSILGAVGVLLGDTLLLAIIALIVGLLALVSYQRVDAQDHGMTTEMSLLLTCLIGGLAIREPLVAAGLGTILAGLLAARNQIHYFVKGVLTEHELHDAILFLAATLILLPLAPDHAIGPFNAINPHTVVSLIVLIMGVSAIGYISTRILGYKFGLPLAGFAAGFISSTATIHAMGVRASKHPLQMKAAVAGAVLSSIATILQMALIVTFIQPSLMKELYLPLLLGGLAACAYGLLLIAKGLELGADREEDNLGHAFNLKTAILFAAVVSLVMLFSAALNDWFGSRGIMLAAIFSGLVDAHANAASIASLVSANKISLHDAALPIMMGLTTNTIIKAVVAVYAGGKAYASKILPGLVFMIAAVWLGVYL
jgi:uncharacterized membrane protein (DUF4010 family)